MARIPLVIMREMRKPFVAALLVSASFLHSQGSRRQDPKQIPLRRPNGATFARDRSGEDTVAKSLTEMLAQQGIAELSRYDPTLLSEGVCSSVLKGTWVHMIVTDEGPSAFYVTGDLSLRSDELRKLVSYSAEHHKAKKYPISFKRYAVAVWKEDMPSGPSRYWVAVVLAKSSISDWLGLHLGADTPKEMRSPNYEAQEDVAPQCRDK